MKDYLDEAWELYKEDVIEAADFLKAVDNKRRITHKYYGDYKTHQV